MNFAVGCASAGRLTGSDLDPAIGDYDHAIQEIVSHMFGGACGKHIVRGVRARCARHFRPVPARRRMLQFVLLQFVL